MSFVLDIEIVIKKNKEKVNLAEHMAKNQASKKNNEDSKGRKDFGKEQNVNVYAMTSLPSNIFALPLSQQADKTTHDAEAKVKEVLNEIIDLCEKGHPDKPVLSKSLRQLLRRKRINKDEKTSKVFKGKVEAIDFLECNRIFMCNYLKMPLQYFNKTIKSSEKQKSTELKTQSEKPMKTTNLNNCEEINSRRKRFKLWKPSAPTIFCFSKRNLEKYSCGDQKHDLQPSSEILLLEINENTENKFAAKRDVSRLSNSTSLDCRANTVFSMNRNISNYSYSVDNMMHKFPCASKPHDKANSVPDLRSNEEYRKLESTETSKSNHSLHEQPELTNLGIIFYHDMDKEVISSEEKVIRDIETSHGIENNDTIIGECNSEIQYFKTNSSANLKSDFINENTPKLAKSDGSTRVKKNEVLVSQSGKQFSQRRLHWSRRPLWCKFPKFMKSFNVH